MTDTLAAAPLTFVPYADRMIVRILDASQRTKSGLVIPDMALDNTPFRRAEVLFVGPGMVAMSTGQRIPIQFKPGSVIVFWRMSQEQLVIPDDEVGQAQGELVIIRESHVAWEVQGLSRVSSVVDTSGRPAVLSS